MSAWSNFAIHHKILIVLSVYYLLGLLIFFSISYRLICHTASLNAMDVLFRPMFWLGNFIWPALPAISINGIC